MSRKIRRKSLTGMLLLLVMLACNITRVANLARSNSKALDILTSLQRGSVLYQRDALWLEAGYDAFANIHSLAPDFTDEANLLSRAHDGSWCGVLGCNRGVTEESWTMHLSTRPEILRFWMEADAIQRCQLDVGVELLHGYRLEHFNQP